MSSNDDYEHQDLPSFEHQDLFKIPDSFFKRGTQFRPVYNADEDRDKLQFAQDKIRNLKKISNEYNKAKEEFGEYFDPKLIFKIETDKSNRAGEKKFSTDLENVDIEIVSAAESDHGKWIGYTYDTEFVKLKKELKQYSDQPHPIYLDFIKDIKSITPNEKKMPNLLNDPIGDDEIANLDVELDIIKSEKEEITKSIESFKKFVANVHGTTTDTYVRHNLCLVRLKCNKQVLEKILKRGQVKTVSRAPKPDIPKPIPSEGIMKKYDVKALPDREVTSILVIDSGIVEHPLLVNALGEINAQATVTSSKIKADQPYDEQGHGTNMASIALYGDMEAARQSGSFQPQIRIHSSKVMYVNENSDSEFDPDELLEHQLASAVDHISTRDKHCKIINLAIGDSSKTAHEISTQLPLAELIDDLAMEHKNMIFVVSAGNIRGQTDNPYPSYFQESSDIVKIIDPATSAHALTIGAVRNYPESDPMNHNVIHPSSMSRIGFGYKDMVKPDLVEFGGDQHHNITCCAREFQTNWFTADYGTSTSASLISHYLAILTNKFPDATRNLIKAFLIASARIPENDLYPIRPLQKGSGIDVWKENLKIYGNGKPNLQNAMFSHNNGLLLKQEAEIELAKVHYYSIYLPDDFVSIRGNREISVTLVYDPPTDSTKSYYLGVTLDFRLFMNQTLEDVKKQYSVDSPTDDARYVSPELTGEIPLSPSIQLRNKNIHQKATMQYSRSPRINTSHPLVLAIRSTNHWIEEPDYQQPYAVIVSIEHENYNELYTQIRETNRIRHRPRVKLGVQEET